MYKTVIFDFDGTLVNSDEVINAVFLKIKDEFGLRNVSAEEIKKFKKKSMKDKITFFQISPFKLPKIVRRVQEEMGKNLHQVSWNEGVLSVLQKLKKANVRLGILSSSSQENLMLFLSLSQVDIFDFVYSGKNLFGKDKDLSKLFKEQHLTKNEALYIGDEVRDIEACKKVGVAVAGVTWGFEEKALLATVKPNYLIDKPIELINIVLGE